MTKQDLQNLIGECMQDYFTDTQPVKENNMTLKKSELKALVNEVVRQCVKEAGPQYKVRTNKSQVEQPGKVNRAREIQSDPKVNEIAPPGGDMPDMGPDMGGEEHYDEQEEIELLKQLGSIVLKLLQMHRGMDKGEPDGEEAGEEGGDGVPFKGPESSEEPEGDEEELQESNHKVQHRSHKTAKDLDNNPKNVRDPEVPQA